MNRKRKMVMGHALMKRENSALTSLVGMTALTIGISKKRLKDEEHLWHITEAMFGMKRRPGEEFIDAVKRIRSEITKIPADQRATMRAAAVPKLDFDFLPNARGRASVISYHRKHLVLVASDGKKVFNNVREHVSKEKREEFYKSWEWRTLRMKVIKRLGRSCQCCGAAPGDKTVSGTPVRIVVDHIKPLSKFWQLRLVEANLQILCDECNQGKGAWDETDYREEPEAAELDDSLLSEYREIMRDDGAA